jgi:RNA polymerase sigma factor (sigma-70 family)
MPEARRGRIDPSTFRALWAEGPMAVRSDADLVRLFAVGHREAAEAAFEALLARHGPTVLGACRRILRDEHEAEDAFQAVFLILARKARSVRVDDSLGRWLHGVTRRVAVRARGSTAREIPPSSGRGDDGGDPAAEVVRAEVRHLIGLEVGRLPRKYREVVALCHLDGLGHDEAAEALGVPVGTVRSRLSRARDFLRPRLIKRGLAPSALAAWLGARPAVASVSKPLLEITLRNATGGASAAISPAVLALVDHALRSFTMAKAMTTGALMAALGALTTGAIVLARGGDEPSKPPTQAARSPEPKKELAPAPAPPLEDQFRRIVKEYDDARARALEVSATGKTEFERWKLINETTPDEADYSRRIVDLAAKHPQEVASRDALIWVMNQPQRSDGGEYGDEFARAARLLVAHHIDDPEVARVGLRLDNVTSRRRESFIEAIYACAEKRETKGLARMALATYLEKRILEVTNARKYPGRNVIHSKTYDDQGKLVERTFPMSNEAEGERVHNRLIDADYVRSECVRLYEEVIAEYADIPYITTQYRDMERKARGTPSGAIADPEKKRTILQVEEYLAKTKVPTLGQVAAWRLDDLLNLAVGKVAPDFEGQGVDGKPLKLSDYRGQVVVLAYWFSTCGPCLRAIPDERELAAKMKGRPFTLLGIVTDGRADDARKVIEAEKITWPNLLVGGDKVAQQYHVSGNPSYFVLDAAGVIRSKGHILPSQLDQLVEKLVGEAEAKIKAGG